MRFESQRVERHQCLAAEQRGKPHFHIRDWLLDSITRTNVGVKLTHLLPFAAPIARAVQRFPPQDFVPHASELPAHFTG
jgi:hypothetical protein